MDVHKSDSDQELAAELGHKLTNLKLEAIFTGVNSLSLVQRLSPAALAYIGDAVYELYVRTLYLLPPKRIADYHEQVVAEVRAETQAQYLERLEFTLNDEEREILRRGRNATGTKPRRLAPEVYQQATSLETLIGYLYLTNPQRLQELLQRLLS